MSQVRPVHKQFDSFIALSLMLNMTCYFDYHELNYILEWASVHQMTQIRFYTLWMFEKRFFSWMLTWFQMECLWLIRTIWLVKANFEAGVAYLVDAAWLTGDVNLDGGT